MAHRPMVTAGWVAEPASAFVSRDGHNRPGSQKENTRRKGRECCLGRRAGNVAGHSHKKESNRLVRVESLNFHLS